MIAPKGGQHALVLSGGAAYAAYEVGVMKALLLGDSPATGYTPMRLSILSGTSAGAFNAAVLLSGGNDLASAVSQLEDVWTMLMGRTSDVASPADWPDRSPVVHTFKHRRENRAARSGNRAA